MLFNEIRIKIGWVMKNDISVIVATVFGLGAVAWEEGVGGGVDIAEQQPILVGPSKLDTHFLI